MNISDQPCPSCGRSTGHQTWCTHWEPEDDCDHCGDWCDPDDCGCVWGCHW